jgi:hypothetical protein
LLFASTARSTARACECASLTPAEAYAQADAVFEGRVLEVSPAPNQAEGTHRLRLWVVRAWKGVTAEHVDLLAAPACGNELVKDQSYFVYASAQGDTLALGECSRTRPMSEADEDQRVLGMGVTTFDPKNGGHVPAPEAKHEPPARGGCASCSALGHPQTHTPFPLALLCLFALSFRRS